MKTFVRTLAVLFAGTLLYIGCSDENRNKGSNEVTSMPHLQKKGYATQLIVNDEPLIMLGGELHNSSTGGFEYMRPVWRRMANANINTLIAPVSWELVEPEEGLFDFALVDSMILGARKEGLKLVVIWFGSWKGGSTHVPGWVKLNDNRFPLIKDEEGYTLNDLSTLSEEACNADTKAFAALMKHIKEIDSRDHTVVMMQVENEIGTLGTKRDYSDIANKAFNGPVPVELIDYLEKNKSTLHPGVLEAWGKQGFIMTGTWEEIFGKGVLMDDWKELSYLTEELFMAWNYAKYVGKVAAAGKAEYNIPMYVNAWIKQPGSSGHAPGNYPSGGPTPQVIDVWRAGAPSIDFIAPDIYADVFRYTCDQYTLSGNPLFIAETRGGDAGYARAFYVFGKYSAMGFCPFGIDGPEIGPVVTDTSLKESYGTLKQLIPLIAEFQGTENISGLLLDGATQSDTVIIGGYKIAGSSGRRSSLTPGAISGQSASPQIGGALIISTGLGEYFIAGKNISLKFLNADPESEYKVGFLSLEDGEFIDGKWITGRRLNGDELRVSFASDQSKIYKLNLYVSDHTKDYTFFQ